MSVDIEKLRRKIQKAKENKSQNDGVIKQLKKQLKDEFDCSDIKSAKQLLKKKKAKFEKLEKEIDEKLSDLEEYE